MRNSKLLSTVLLAGMLAGCTTHKYEVYFKPGSAELTSASKATIMRAVGDLKEHSLAKTKLLGFTDNTGSSGLNYNLAIKRVAKVGDMLEKNGIPDRRITSNAEHNNNNWIYAGDLRQHNTNERRVDIRIYRFLWF